MPDFSFETIFQNSVQIIRTRGYLDMNAGDRLQNLCKEKLGENINLFIFNFGESPVINSAGLSIILGIFEKILDKEGGKIAICGLSNLAKTALRTIGVLRLVSECDSEEAGISKLSAK